MELWGSLYLLQESAPTKLVGTIGSSTGPIEGQVNVSFLNDVKVLHLVVGVDLCELSITSDLAMRLIAFLHILLLQNRILRSEERVIGDPVDPSSRFETAWAAEPILVCTWRRDHGGVRVQVEGAEAGTQVELVLTEDAAVDLLRSLAKAVARRGVRNALVGRVSG